MSIAWRELRRTPGRFAVATITLSLIAMLLMVLGALRDGLLGQATGSYKAQPGDLMVFSSESNAVLGASVVTKADRAAVEEALPDGSEVGGVASLVVGARVDGADERELEGVNLFAYELAPAGLPEEAPAAGEVWADADLATAFEAGDTLLLGPARIPVEIVGFLERGDSPSQGALWGSWETFGEVLVASRPGAALPDGASQALVVALPDGADASEAIAAVDDATGTTATLTIEDAANAIPGVDAQRSTFAQIIGVTAAIALLVVALFFALMTVERTGLYGVLKAIGAKTGTIFAGVVLQALVVTLVAASVGAILVGIANFTIPPGTVPFALDPMRLVISVGLLAVAAMAGSILSLRRVVKIDPASAIGGEA